MSDRVVVRTDEEIDALLGENYILTPPGAKPTPESDAFFARIRAHGLSVQQKLRYGDELTEDEYRSFPWLRPEQPAV